MGTVVGLAELLIQTTDWSNLQAVGGSAQDIGTALSDLLAAQSPKAASEAYWRIENHAVVQGELFQSAEACTAVLVSALTEERPRHVRICILDLLHQILNGAPSGTSGTPPDILERCRRAAQEGVWVLLKESIGGESDAAWDVVEGLTLGERTSYLKNVVRLGRKNF